MVKRVLPLFSMLAIALLVSTAMFGQNPKGSLTGTVLDAQGASIVGASVEAKDSTTGSVVFTGTSGVDGHFQASNLAPGVYTVTVSTKGFKTGVFTDVKITVGQTYDLPAKLEVGEVNTVVNVEGGGAQIVETQNASVSNVIAGRAITDLPFNARSAVLLGVLDPGAQTVGSSRSTQFEGLPKSSINITFDGINIQDQLLKSSDGFFATNDPRVDDVEEFSITDAANSADKSGEGAIQMNYVSKRGGNAWHGGAWETFRNTVLDANYFFNNETNLPRQILKFNDFGYKIGGPILKDKLFFFTDMDIFQLPASIARSRNILTPLAATGVLTYKPVLADGKTACVPGAAGCVGNGIANNWTTCSAATGTCGVDLFALATNSNCGVATPCATTMDPTVKTFLGDVESARAANGVTTSTSCTGCNPLWQNQINFNATQMQTRRYPDLRVDYQISQHHSLELDYHYAHYDSAPDVLNNRDATYPVAPFATNTGAQLSNRNLWVVAWRWQIGSNMSNELRAGVQLAPINFGLGITPNGYPTNATNLGTVPYTFGITGVSTFLASPAATSGRNSALGQVLDNFTWTKGSHNMAFGFLETDIHYNEFDVQAAAVTLGVTSADPAASTMFATGRIPGITSTDLATAEGLYGSLSGRVTGYSNNIAFDPKTGNFGTGNPLLIKANQLELGFYATDSWRVRPNLTATYGLRWNYDGPPNDKLNELYMLSTGYAGLFGVSGQGNLFSPGTLTGSVPNFVNDAGKKWWNQYWKAFAPQVGLAWQPNFDNSWYKAIFGGAGKTVIRADYSIAYDREGIENFLTIAEGNPGFTGSQVFNAGSQFSDGSVMLRNGGFAGVSQTPTSFVSSFPLTAASGASVNSFAPNLKPGMVQSWTLGIQREIGNNQALEVRYVGNHGAGLWRQYNLNENNILENGFLSEFNNAKNNLAICKQDPTCSTPANVTYANVGLPGQVNLPIMTATFTGSKTGSQTNSNFKSATFINDLNLGLAGAFAGSLNGSVANWQRLVTAGFSPNFWMVNPDARGGSFVIDNSTQSTYNGLIVDFRRRQSKGLYFDVNYAFAKSLTNYYTNSQVSFLGFTTLRDRGYDKGPAIFDIRHAVKGQMLYELPFGEGKRWNSHSAFANRIIGGWAINSITLWQTGSPIQITSGVGGTFNGSDPGLNLVGITASQLQGLLTTNKTQAPGAIFYVPQSLLDPSGNGRANTSILQPCNTAGALCSKVFVWGPQFFRTNLSLVKTTKITERVSVELRAEALNAFNDTDFYYACSPGTTGGSCAISTQSTAFGKMAAAYTDFNTTQDPGGRVLQLVGRVNF